MKLKEQIYYVGVNDRTKHLFEGLWPLPNGISYNSYLIVDDRVTLIDTVEAAFFEEHLCRIRRVLGQRPIDYLVINHMEPDHSGSINLLRRHYPDLTLVGNAQTQSMIDGFYGLGGNRLQVDDGETLSIGRHRLHFHLIPMVHWPETMATWEEREGVLFSGDAFGCFGALNGGVTDNSMETAPYYEEMVRYYSNIVGKYGAQVQKALHKLQPLPVQMICPTHGPVWSEEIPQVVALYDRLSRYEAEKGLVICYGSMYGNTLRMAEEIACAAARGGVKRIVMHDVCRTHSSYIIADVFRYRGLMVGAPTYNGELFPEMESLLKKLTARNLRNRLFGFFGAFTWAGQALRRISALTETARWELVGQPVEMKQGNFAVVQKACRELGAAMAERM